jgi:hypothetical protein
MQEQHAGKCKEFCDVFPRRSSQDKTRSKMTLLEILASCTWFSSNFYIKLLSFVANVYLCAAQHYKTSVRYKEHVYTLRFPLDLGYNLQTFLDKLCLPK